MSLDRPINRELFFAKFPSHALYGSKLTPGRKSGFVSVFDFWDSSAQLDYAPWLAYALATAWHETAATMLPVREGLKNSDVEAYDYVTAYCKKEGKPNYAARHANGNSYYGRGYVQLTHGYNYREMGIRLGRGDALYNNPDLVLDKDVASEILMVGLMEGRFRPRYGTLRDYFQARSYDWFDARDVVNGDKRKIPKWTNGKSIGEVVADYGRGFLGALT